jgi:hypothetical protein
MGEKELWDIFVYRLKWLLLGLKVRHSDDDEMTKLSPSYGFMHDLVLLNIHPLGHREVCLQLLSRQIGSPVWTKIGNPTHVQFLFQNLQ